MAELNGGLCELPRAATGVLFLEKQGRDRSRMVEQRDHQSTGQRLNARSKLRRRSMLRWLHRQTKVAAGSANQQGERRRQLHCAVGRLRSRQH